MSRPLAFEAEPSNRRYRLRLARYRYLPEALGEALPEGSSTVFDVGCGKGRLPLYWKRWAPPSAKARLVGLDISPDRLAQAATRGYDLLVRCDLSRGIPAPDGAVDAVVCEQVLEHLTDDEVTAALGEVRRALTPGGVAVLGVPVFPKLVLAVLPIVLRTRSALRRRRGQSEHGSHHQHFSVDAFRDLVSRHGLRVENVRGFRVISLPGNWLEDQQWWYRLQRWLGARFPGLCTEATFVCRPAEAEPGAAHR